MATVDTRGHIRHTILACISHQGPRLQSEPSSWCQPHGPQHRIVGAVVSRGHRITCKAAEAGAPANGGSVAPGVGDSTAHGPPQHQPQLSRDSTVALQLQPPSAGGPSAADVLLMWTPFAAVISQNVRHGPAGQLSIGTCRGSFNGHGPTHQGFVDHAYRTASANGQL